MTKLLRISTIPVSLNILLKGQLRYLDLYFDVAAISGAGPDLETVAEREGVRVHEVEMQRQIAPLKDLISLWKLYRFFKKEKPHIIHSITPKAGLLSMVAGKWAGIPIRMHTFTGLIFPTRTGLMQILLIQMDRLLCSCATHIYPEGQGVKRDLQKYKITNKPLKVIANGNVNGIDTAFFSRTQIPEMKIQEMRETLGIVPNDFVFIFIGRLVGDKGINELVMAFKGINQPQTKLLFVGPLETELDPLMPETLSEIETNKNILTTGFQSEVRLYFALADALVFPSYREGFPNVVLQAGAMELPAIVSDINGCNEIITDGENGLIVPSKNTEQLAAAMMRLLADKKLYNKLKAQTRSRIVQNYEQAVVWQAILDEYEKAEQDV